MEKQKLRKIIITLSFLTLLCCFFFVSSASASTSGAYVYKVNKGSPVVDLDKYRVSTITRGGAANQPFKVLSQVVPKLLFRSVFKKLIGVSPYGILALAAYETYGYVFNDDSELVIRTQVYDAVNSIGYCSGTGSNGIRSMDACGNFSTDKYYEAETGCSVDNPCKLNLYWISKNSYHNANDSAGYVTFTPSNLEVIVTDQSLTDEDFLSAHDQFISSNPELNHNDMFNDEYGNVIPEMFPNPEYVEYTQADIDLIELYEAGLMQSEDPNAANYYPPSTIAKAKELSEAKAAQDARTAEDEAKKLTEDEKLPITQAQHKTNQLEAEARQEATIAESVSALTGIDLVEKNVDTTATVDQGWTDMTTMLNTTNDLPTSNFANYFDFTSSTGCETIPLPYFGVFPNAEQCVKLGTVKTFLAYFLSVLLAWNMINITLKEAN